MSGPNFEGCASFFEKTEREARETTKVNIYGCSLKGANMIDIYDCAGCKSLSKDPVETLSIPKSVIEQGEEVDYVDKHSRFGISPRKLNCGFKALI